MVYNRDNRDVNGILPKEILRGLTIMGKILSDNIRNIAIVGHSGAGKTSLAEALLFNGKSIDRLGKTSDKNTVMDYDEQEMARGISISLACANTTWRDVKINVVDVPGFYDFEGEFEQAMRAVGSAILVADVIDVQRQ